jgi:hypothetical protein
MLLNICAIEKRGNISRKILGAVRSGFSKKVIFLFGYSSQRRGQKNSVDDRKFNTLIL